MISASQRFESEAEKYAVCEAREVTRGRYNRDDIPNAAKCVPGAATQLRVSGGTAQIDPGRSYFDGPATQECSFHIVGAAFELKMWMSAFAAAPLRRDSLRIPPRVSLHLIYK
jgi:hypothetical protein